MAELTEIRQGIADSLTPIFGEEMQISPLMLANATMPYLHVFPDETTYHEAMGNGAETWALTVELLVGMVDTQGAQLKLDAYLASQGAKSIKAALEGPGPGPNTLGGLVTCVTVTRTSGYRQYQVGGAQGLALGATWTLSVFV